MQAFVQIHNFLLENLETPYERLLSSQINWNHRLIGIKGTRGIGKTMFLLDYAKKTYGFDRSCLYVNLNNLYFTQRSIREFADDFRKMGGKTLILDQVYKYPNWSEELKYCYDNYTDLQIIFSGSTVMRLREENPLLKNIVHSYKIEGFSFREFLELKTGEKFDNYSLNDILDNHIEIAKEIVNKVRPYQYFEEYLKYGHYPYFLTNQSYDATLMKNINFILEIDISFLRQIELKYLHRLRKLLYSIAQLSPYQPNVSRLSNEIETSRATVMNYIYYLRQARLVKLLYEDQEDMLRKPEKVFLHNPNLLYALKSGVISRNELNETFFYNQVGCIHDICSSPSETFLVNKEYHFNVDVDKHKTKGKNHYHARDMIEIGSGNEIPLWLFGFMY